MNFKIRYIYIVLFFNFVFLDNVLKINKISLIYHNFIYLY